MAADVSKPQRTFVAAAGYVNSLIEARVDASSTTGSGSDSHREGFQLGTALAFADGEIGLSRPLRGQPFALVKARNDLGDTEVGVTRGRGSNPVAYLGRIGRRAVVPHLSPYYAKEIGVQTQNLPMGIDIERDNFLVYPTYRSGTLLEVGADTPLFLRGQLVDARGETIPLAFGTFVPADDRRREVEFFTDDQGHFEASGLAAGGYEIVIRGRTDLHGLVEIPPDVTGIHDLGAVSLVSKTNPGRRTP